MLHFFVTPFWIVCVQIFAFCFFYMDTDMLHYCIVSTFFHTMSYVLMELFQLVNNYHKDIGAL